MPPQTLPSFIFETAPAALFFGACAFLAGFHFHRFLAARKESRRAEETRSIWYQGGPLLLEHLRQLCRPRR